jgi:hypothetical protein
VYGAFVIPSAANPVAFEAEDMTVVEREQSMHTKLLILQLHKSD